jgi:hypothetical protein
MSNARRPRTVHDRGIGTAMVMDRRLAEAPEQAHNFMRHQTDIEEAGRREPGRVTTNSLHDAISRQDRPI